jgi:hypothetical protein
VGTAFTYQGRLTDDQGTPLTGSYDFEFRLYNGSGGGAQQIGTTVTKNDVTVDDGYFTVGLDFGVGTFTGEERWLAISVREGGSTGNYTPLSPRQALTPTPYALALPGLRTDPSPPVPNILGGYIGNAVDNGISGGTIGGGGASGEVNRITGNHGTIGGGSLNTAGVRGTVAGGQNNQAGSNATVGGGLGNVASDQAATVGGGQDNVASYLYGTVGGGLHNIVRAYGGTIAGGAPANTSDPTGTRNSVTDHYGTIGGGGNNLAGNDDGTLDNAPWATVGGGQDNEARANGATIGGGVFNRAYGYRAVVAGGSTNYANGQYATVTGGFQNAAGDNRATIGGGDQNQASGPYATVAGGRTNVAGGTDVYHATVGGGVDNEATGSGATVAGGNDNLAGGTSATIPGGFNNEARGNYSFAAGYRARANHQGSFVWADATKADFASTGEDQFLIRAAGGTGIGTPDPIVQFHAVDARSGSDIITNHVALIENSSINIEPDVLALKVGETGSLESNNNFLTFFDGDNNSVGAVEGSGGSGVSYQTTAADFAEMMPLRSDAEIPESGDIVGIFEDGISRSTQDAHQVAVISTEPGFVGNAPEDEDANDHVLIAMVGQVPVSVLGAVEAGDYIVPSGLGNGIGIAVAPEAITAAQMGQVVGQALESREDIDVGQVKILVGLPQAQILETALQRRDARMDQLETRIAALEAAMAETSSETHNDQVEEGAE